MGAAQSSSQAQSPSRGLHVLRVTPSSPASLSNIEPFFDFVVGFEGDSLSAENNIDAFELEKIVESHENRILNLLVWNSKNQRTRGMVEFLLLLTTIALYFESSRIYNTIARMVATTLGCKWFSKFASHFTTFTLGSKYAHLPARYCHRQRMACS